MPDRVLISCIHVLDRMDTVGPVLDRHGIEWDLADVIGQQLSEADLVPIIGRYDAILAGDDELSAEVIAHAQRLRVITKWGVGIDAIDVTAAEKRGIAIVNTPGMFGHEIADYALTYILLLFRQQHRVDRLIRAGHWPKIRGHSVAGHTLGIVGLGSSGRELARRGIALDMHVVATDVAPPPDEELALLGCRFLVDVDEVFSEADIVSLHAPLTPQTRGLVDGARLSRLGPGGLLINTARGGLVDEAALVDALKAGTLAGAALDVFEDEPLDAEHPLRSLDNVILGSHNASNTWEAVERTTSRAVEELVAALEASR